MLLKVGDKAPEFSLLNQDEELISSKKLVGTRFFKLQQLVQAGTKK